MFSDAFSKDHQLIRADPKHSLYLACALMLRGNVQVSDLRRNIERSDHHPLTLSPSAPTPQTIQYTHPDNAHTQLSQIVLPFSIDSKDSWLAHSAASSPLLCLHRSPRRPCFHVSRETETEAAVRAHICAWPWCERGGEGGRRMKSTEILPTKRVLMAQLITACTVAYSVFLLARSLLLFFS